MVFTPGSYHSAALVHPQGRAIFLTLLVGPAGGEQPRRLQPVAIGLRQRTLGRQGLGHAFQQSVGKGGGDGRRRRRRGFHARRSRRTIRTTRPWRQPGARQPLGAAIPPHDAGRTRPRSRDHGRPFGATGKLGTASSSQRDLIAVCVWRAPRRRISSCRVPPWRAISPPPARREELAGRLPAGAALSLSRPGGWGRAAAGHAPLALAAFCPEAYRRRLALRFPLSLGLAGARRLTPPAHPPPSAFLGLAGTLLGSRRSRLAAALGRRRCGKRSLAAGSICSRTSCTAGEKGLAV